MAPRKMVDVAPPEDVVTRLMDVIGEKTPAASVEFGYHEEDDPKLEGRRWWAKVTLRSGRALIDQVLTHVNLNVNRARDAIGLDRYRSRRSDQAMAGLRALVEVLGDEEREARVASR